MEAHHPEPPSKDRTMLRTRTALAASLLAAALAPAAASAAPVHLGGQPTLRQVDAHHAQLRFAADRLPRGAGGAVAARVRIAGQRVGALHATGRHGRDVVYSARVTAPASLRAGAKYTVRIEVPGQAALVRLVKLHPAS
jgi:hypothetical protein